MTDETTQNTEAADPATGQTAPEGSQGQQNGQAPAAQPQDAYETLRWDNVPLEAWSALRNSVERGELEPGVIDRWQSEAKQRQDRYRRDYTERGELLKAVRKMASGKSTERQEEPGSAQTPASAIDPVANLKARLGEEAEHLGAETVEALGQVIQETAAQAAERKASELLATQQAASAQTDQAAIVRANEDRQEARLRERFPGLAEHGYLLQEIADLANTLSSDVRYASAGTMEERFDRVYDDASAVVAARHPYLSQGGTMSPESTSPAGATPQPAAQQPAHAPPISAGTRPTEDQPLSHRERQILAAQTFDRGRNVDSARRTAGMAPAPRR